MKRVVALIVVAVPLGFVVALWALGVLAPPICPWFRNVCATAHPWRGQYGYPPSLGLVGSPWLDTPTPPSFLLLWAAAASAIWLLLWAVAWLRRRAGLTARRS